MKGQNGGHKVRDGGGGSVEKQAGPGAHLPGRLSWRVGASGEVCTSEVQPQLCVFMSSRAAALGEWEEPAVTGTWDKSECLSGDFHFPESVRSTFNPRNPVSPEGVPS